MTQPSNTQTSNIDDVLAAAQAAKSGPTPTNTLLPDPPEEVPENVSSDDTVAEPEVSLGAPPEPEAESESKAAEPASVDLDEYGNKKSKSRTFTEEEVNERINKAIRDRLSRGNQVTPPDTAATNSAVAQGFEYDPNSADAWQVQLESFVEQTVTKMGQKQAQKNQQAREQQAQIELQQKIQNGLDRFSDFREVVGTQPITDAMTLSLRGMNDPSSFLYSASTRMPKELKRISELSDPYAQMVEMGKLEERLRQSRTTTKTPRPMSRTSDDGIVVREPAAKTPTIEDLIAQSDTKRRAALNAKRGR